MKKNVAIIIPKLTGGGAERAAAKLSEVLNEKANVYVVIYNSKHPKTYSYSGKLLSLEDKQSNTIIGKAMGSLKRIIKLKRLKNDYKIDTSISFMENPNFINVLSKKKDKTIISVRNFKSTKSNNIFDSINKSLMKRLYNKADIVVSVSELIKEDLIENFSVHKEKITTIYNSYNINNCIEQAKVDTPQELDDFFKSKVIINVGRMEKQKGQKHLIKAFSKLKEDGMDVKLLMLGEGSLKEELIKLTIELGVENEVKFLGFQTNPFKFLKKSDIFVLSSLHEGFPNALCEAMICGLPIISTDCKSGPREILSKSRKINYQTDVRSYEEFGILVPVPTFIKTTHVDNTILNNEEKELYESMKELLSNRKMYLDYSQKSSERMHNFTEQRISQLWDNII